MLREEQRHTHSTVEARVIRNLSIRNALELELLHRSIRCIVLTRHEVTVFYNRGMNRILVLLSDGTRCGDFAMPGSSSPSHEEEHPQGERAVDVNELFRTARGERFALALVTLLSHMAR